MDPAITVALVTGSLGLFGSTVTAFFLFRGGMPAASDDMANGFSQLNKELRAELQRVREAYEAELEELRQQYKDDVDALKIRVTLLETQNNYLRREHLQSDYRATYYRNGAFALWNQFNDLKAREIIPKAYDPYFDPRVDKYPPIKPRDDDRSGTQSADQEPQ